MRRAAALLLALVCAACGYRTGFTPPDDVTVGVAFFDNQSKERNLERDLHGPLTDSVQRLVDAPLVTPSAAEYRIEGRVLDFRRRGGIRDTNNVQLETGVRITVEARLMRRGLAGVAGAPSEPEILRMITVSDERGYALDDPDGESQARENALRNIADRIVIELFADLAWDSPAP